MNQQSSVVRINQPCLAPAEREKRMEAIKRAAAALVVASEIIHRKEGQNEHHHF